MAAACCARLGVPLDLAGPDPAIMVVTQGEAFPLHFPPFRGQNGALRRLLHVPRRWPFLLRSLGYGLGALLGWEAPVADWFRGISRDDRLLQLVDHLTKFSFGVAAADASAGYLLRSIRALRGLRGEGFLRGGNLALVTSLQEHARAHGAVVRTGARVARILCEGQRAAGVVTEAGERLPAGIVVSNAGVHATLRLLGEAAPADFRARVARAKAACGATHALRSRRHLHAHASIEINLDLPHVAGIAPISNLCPALCPPGWHFSLAYQALDAAQPVEPQVDAARRELTGYFGKDVELFNTATYWRGHPAAPLTPIIGQNGPARFAPTLPGLAGCYLVGEDLAGYGFAAEVVGAGALALWRRLEREYGGEA